jgi:tetratricopeptide (TPR) repeat protein
MIVQDSTQALPDFNKMWNYGDPAATEAKFLEVLPQAEASGNSDYLAQLLTQIARTQGLQNRFTEAHTTLDRADKLITVTMHLAKVRSLLERGRAYNSSDHADKALPLFLRAVDVATKNHIDLHAVDAIHMVAIAEPNPKLKVEWNLKGITIAEADEKLHGWLWALYNNIGESYLKLNDYANAYLNFHKLSEYQKKRTGSTDMFTSKDEAKCLRLLGKPAEALAIIQPVYNEQIAKQNDNGFIRAEVAEALEALGRHDEAKPHFVTAYELLSVDEYATKFEQPLLSRLKAMSGN